MRVQYRWWPLDFDAEDVAKPDLFPGMPGRIVVRRYDSNPDSFLIYDARGPSADWERFLKSALRVDGMLALRATLMEIQRVGYIPGA